jgi:hypothetical protein
MVAEKLPRALLLALPVVDADACQVDLCLWPGELAERARATERRPAFRGEDRDGLDATNPGHRRDRVAGLVIGSLDPRRRGYHAALGLNPIATSERAASSSASSRTGAGAGAALPLRRVLASCQAVLSTTQVAPWRRAP